MAPMKTPDGLNSTPESPSLTLVTGDIGAGKTTRIVRYVNDCRARGLHVGGVIARRTRDGYEFVDVNSGCARAYAARNPEQGHAARPRFRFDAEAFAWLNGVLRSAVEDRCDVIVYDEYGPLEHGGGGAFGALKAISQQFRGRLAIAVRRSLADHVAIALGIPPAGVEIIDVGFLS